jgi:shikimate dehydrogenase
LNQPHAFGIAGLLGWPVAHSRSPVIHNHWLAQHGIPGRYVLFPVPPEKLEAAVRGIAALGLRGCNVTTPHKQAVFPLLDRVDELARRIGAVNTVVVEKDGTLTGFNNDGNGFIQSLRDVDPEWGPASGPVLVLGAGGAARAVVASLAAQGATEIRVANRTLGKARDIADAVGPVVKVVPWEERSDALEASRCSPMPRASARPISRRSRCRSIGCPETRWWATSSTSRPRRHCWPRRARAATSPSTASACSSTRHARRSTPGSA